MLKYLGFCSLQAVQERHLVWEQRYLIIYPEQSRAASIVFLGINFCDFELAKMEEDLHLC